MGTEGSAAATAALMAVMRNLAMALVDEQQPLFSFSEILHHLRKREDVVAEVVEFEAQRLERDSFTYQAVKNGYNPMVGDQLVPELWRTIDGRFLLHDELVVFD
ncbi:hypothetical protein Bca52824_003795 [Brassica carinata]|uniref:Uncharacterized protein n=1 Tax=Brassica carinata TaxID=52824 RepID=A0A8X7WNT7_BRACI|nr:hypothetical protein Bca52824_003795 [Brassica carinata]